MGRSDTSGIVEHYGGARLLAAIESGLAELGMAPGDATVEVLGSVDEFHVGGRHATVDLCERLAVDAGMKVLDVGCGIGGTSRFVADATGCRVTGLDLSPTFVDVARTLTEWTGLDDRVRFEAGSATQMPFDDESFDAAVMLHVGMNIADKATLFAEIARVLRPGGRLGVYDLVRRTDGDISFPVPWAGDPSQSVVGRLDEYERLLTAAGFDVQVHDRTEFARAFFERQQAVSAAESPPLGLHLIVGLDAPTKFANLRRAIDEGILSPVQFVCTLR